MYWLSKNDFPGKQWFFSNFFNTLDDQYQSVATVENTILTQPNSSLEWTKQLRIVSIKYDEQNRGELFVCHLTQRAEKTKEKCKQWERLPL